MSERKQFWCVAVASFALSALLLALFTKALIVLAIFVSR